MTALYNEIDPFAAAWLRELIKAGQIAPGIVVEESIEDLKPNDLKEFTQVHLFAGIGGWSHALRKAGWPDDRRVWTASCPCQPFSTAGKGSGFNDERHLWPHVDYLVSQCRPCVIFGEQVASKDGLKWLDLVQTDMEAQGYAFGALDLCAAGIGAPHIRQRLYWVADSMRERQQGSWIMGQSIGTEAESNRKIDRAIDACRGGGMGDSVRAGLEARIPNIEGLGQGDGRQPAMVSGAPHGTLPTNGQWRDADWLSCRDGKWRPVEPGTFPLAHGVPARVGRLRGYGNAIVAPLAEEFIRAYMAIDEPVK